MSKELSTVQSFIHSVVGGWPVQPLALVSTHNASCRAAHATEKERAPARPQTRRSALGARWACHSPPGERAVAGQAVPRRWLLLGSAAQHHRLDPGEGHGRSPALWRCHLGEPAYHAPPEGTESMSLPVKSLLQSLVYGRAGALSFSVAWAALQEAFA